MAVELGAQLRTARKARGEDVDAVSAATGIAPATIRALEAGDASGMASTGTSITLARRYAAHLGVDPTSGGTVTVTTELPDDADADTQEIPIVVRPPRRADSNLVWLGLGAAAGVAGLVIFGGGLGGGSDRSSQVAAPAAQVASNPAARQPAPARPAPNAAPKPVAPSTGQAEPVNPAPANDDGLALTLDARSGKTVWIEVRVPDVRGKQLFAGIVGGGVTRTITTKEETLYLSVAWAPNARIAVNGDELDADGGVEAYSVSVSGLRRLTNTGG